VPAALYAFLDASVLYPVSLRNLLMRLALAGVYHAKWSAHVHEEWIRAVLRDHPGLSIDRLHEIRAAMDRHAEDSLVTGYEALIPAMQLPDPNDRHVLAAAVVARADVIVTPLGHRANESRQNMRRHLRIFASWVFAFAKGSVAPQNPGDSNRHCARTRRDADSAGDGNQRESAQVFSEGFALVETHHPHLSILQQFVRTDDLNKVFSAAVLQATADIRPDIEVMPGRVRTVYRRFSRAKQRWRIMR